MENQGPKPLLSIVKKLSETLETSTIYPGDSQKQIHNEAMTLRLINRIFERFEQRYEGLFRRAYPTEADIICAKKNWGREIASVPMDKIKRAMESVFHVYPDWPPTLNQFIHVCYSAQPRSTEHHEMYKPYLPKLEKTTWAERQARAKIGIQVARNILKKK